MASDTRVTTGVVRASFTRLFEPVLSKGDTTPKYSVTLLIPKTDKATYKALRAAEAEAAEIGKSKKFGGKIPSNLATVIRDGDTEADLELYPENAGHWYMAVRNTRRPLVVDQNLNEILDATEVYSGCYIKASVDAFPYNFEGKKGISFSITAVQKVRDGESLGGVAKVEASDVFKVIATDDDEDDLV